MELAVVPDQYPGRNAAGSGAAETGSLLYEGGDFGVQDDVYTFEQSSPSLALTFFASGLPGLASEAWGLDNVDVRIK